MPIPSLSVRLRPLWPCLLLLAITLLAYWPAVHHGGFVWDDDDHLTRNVFIQQRGGMARIWTEFNGQTEYYPLTLTVFWFEYRFWGLTPWPYHLASVLFHAANALLLYWIVRKLHLRAAWFIAAVFALHPVQVESVAWITELKNVLSGLFFLLATASYLRFAGLFTSSDSIELSPSSRPWRFYAAAILFFLAALLSKTVTCTLPAALFLVLWWKRPRIAWRDIWPLLPIFILGLSLAAITAIIEKTQVGSVGVPWNYSLLQRSAIAGRAIVFYLHSLLWPANLAFSYPLWDIRHDPWWQYLFPIGVAVLLATLFFLRRHIGRGPLAALLIFIAILSPALGFIDYYTMRFSLVADHYQYLACIAIVALALETAAVYGGKTIFTLLMSLVLLVAGTLTWRQSSLYCDAATLWIDTIAKNPNSYIAHENLGIELLAQSQVEPALEHFHRALALYPDSPDGYYNLGNALLSAKRTSEAIAAYQQGLQLPSASIINRAQLHYGLGNALTSQNQLATALEHFQTASQLQPKSNRLRYALAYVLAAQGQTDAAIANLQTILQLDPQHALAQSLLRTLTASPPSAPSSPPSSSSIPSTSPAPSQPASAP